MSGPSNISAIASGIMAKYDHNQNRVIDLERADSKSKIGKFFGAKEKSELVDSNTTFFTDGEDFDVSTTVKTRMKLFYAADAKGNNDGKVTQKELENVIKTFDKNGDGELESVGFMSRLFSGFSKDKGEIQKFNDNFGEELKSYSSISTYDF